MSLQATLAAATSTAGDLERQLSTALHDVRALEVRVAQLVGPIPRDAYIRQLETALRFYAARSSYIAQNPGLGCPVWGDLGEHARKALGITAQTIVDDLNAREDPA